VLPEAAAVRASPSRGGCPGGGLIVSVNARQDIRSFKQAPKAKAKRKVGEESRLF
jgi:hypothetical protein